ncbi:P-loop containing nucleoside triphosphate hydrolase protein [Coprinopsis sp. MPI-PUGE-AT-0042]|nr:P-loop containing nucleoside triphosphate hydrolase protein [Coprinopsis sp. MPI-PUGE-AT-0042]
MRLSALVPGISLETVKALESVGIRTDADLLFRPAFEIYKQLPPGTLTRQELTRFCSTVTELTAAEPITGTALLLEEEERLVQDANLDLKIGDEAIDELLAGLGGRRVIEISGDRASGKTTLALNIVLNHLRRNRKDRAVWIDALGDFSPARATAVLESLGEQESTLVFERLLVSLAFDLETLHAVLDEVFPENIENPPRYLVIDLITPLLGPQLSGVTAHGHATMTDIMRRLRNIASCGTTVLVINSATRTQEDDSSQRKPALGPSFTFMTDTTLWLSDMRELSEPPFTHCLKILKSRDKASGISPVIGIQNGRVISR